MTIREIAVALGVSHGTVQLDFDRAIAKIRKALGMVDEKPAK